MGNGGRHCGSGDMAYLCGGCSFCSGTPSPSPSPSPSPDTRDCARRLNNYDTYSAACLVKDRVKGGLLVYVPYDSSYAKRGWDFPGGNRKHGEYACETAERETCEETGHKVRALYKLSGSVFMCELVQEDYCTQAVDEGILKTWWVTKDEVYSVKYRTRTWGDKPGLLHANL